MEPWDILDVDDSNVSSFIRPSKRQTLIPLPIDHRPHTQTLNRTPSFSPTLRPCSQFKFRAPQTQPLTPSLTFSTDCSDLDSRALLSGSLPQLETSTSRQWRIPGPAGAVQAAMQRKAWNVGQSERGEDGEPPVSTQEYIRRAVEDGGEDDGDFTLNPWICAVDFVRRAGLVGGDGAAIGTPLCSINIGFKDKVPQVVAVVKSCTPNGLGDLMVTLKDPTGTIGASIHRKVLAETDFGKEISVGAVLILQKVAVFSPSRSVHYLNVTVNNVIKVISKDIEPLSGQDHIAKTLNHVSALEGSERPCPQKNSVTKAKGMMYEIMSSFRQGAKPRENTEKELTQTASNVQIEPGHGELHTRTMDRYSQSGCAMEVDSIDGRHKEALTSRTTSLPKWTDEQLDQLLDYD